MRQAPAGVIKLVLVDVDGVITRGEGADTDLAIFDELAKYGARAETDALVPPLALCTGRQAPYVELVAQMAHVRQPCIFEHGCGLYLPDGYARKTLPYEFHPALRGRYFEQLAALRQALEEPLLRPGLAFVQPGKEASMSLYPLGSMTLEELGEAAQRVVKDLGLSFTVALNVHGIELRPEGMDKGVGARWLADRLQVPLAAMAGVGDSDPDLTYLRLVAFSAAPANATPGVQAAVDYVASTPFGAGLLDILARIEQGNRQLAG